MTNTVEFPGPAPFAVGKPPRPLERPPEILLISSDHDFAELIRARLKAEGHPVESIDSIFEAEEKAVGKHYAAIILNVCSGDRQAGEACRNLRRLGVSAPILALTPELDKQQRVRAFEAGADHCLTTPIDWDELSARVRALVRRGRAREATTLSFEDIEMDLVKHRVHRAGEAISLSRREFELLEYMLRNPNKVLSRTVIADRVWGRRERTQSNVISVYVYMLRKKVDKPFGKRLIHTVPGSGYLLSGDHPEA